MNFAKTFLHFSRRDAGPLANVGRLNDASPSQRRVPQAPRNPTSSPMPDMLFFTNRINALWGKLSCWKTRFMFGDENVFPPRLWLVWSLCSLIVLPNTASWAATPELPAFPGAEGFGATTPGGRGGKVIFVTNLNDAGPGSLRAACVATGPRIIVFRVAGTIALKSPITIRSPYVTLATQTAPGDGICVRDGTFGVATHDVIIRFLRCRLGDIAGRQADSLDVLNGSRDVIFDHCSATWSVDETLSLSGDNQNITIQWCLIGESLRQSKHPKGAHGYGSLARANGPVTFHHNLWTHNDSRNPRLGDFYGRGPAFPTFDVRNNIIYDFGATASGLTQGKLKVNYVGNYIRPGPSSTARTPITIGANSDLQFFIRENIFEGNDTLTVDNTRFFNAVELEEKTKDGATVMKREVRTVEQPFDAPRVTTVPAQNLLEWVLPTVGASLPKRDSVDSRLIDQLRNRTGKLIDSQAQVGGWPELKSGEVPLDSDQDGMPDAWEITHKLNPHDSADSSLDSDKDGYSNIEEYLNGIVPNPVLKVNVPMAIIDAEVLTHTDAINLQNAIIEPAKLSRGINSGPAPMPTTNLPPSNL
jgi:pectate lyase